ncbi:M23 family metallopeptidase [Streptomyces sp. SAJ15]|uniref:M23 family metallopeptidase n=1 Tax=Streptomyces sp. SAJ15 TaxID=2011095 RepID=UPI001185EDF8|nr:M23 family metallopeptidase [Streptomyces sp. SAJ15]TVL93871.1 peptidase M23 [Streptomyces sp. SAJ15]
MRKAGMVLYRCSWIVFIGYCTAGFFYDLPYLWGWIPLGLALTLASVMNRRPGEGAQPASTAAGGERPTGTDPEPRAEDAVHAGRPAPVEVDPPVSGRWSALNSPADSVPSHGTHAYGQTYAIDIVAEPADGARPNFGWWPLARRNRAFPAFGAPLLAVADATVVRATDRQRDHLSRNSFPALLYLLVEGMFREMGGPSRITGNHLVLDLGDGTYAMYAHLRRGSLTVRAGDRVRAGQRLARCGNSGNSSEPHVHFQLMDHPDLDVARGIPFTWRGVGVPRGGEVFTVAEHATV